MIVGRLQHESPDYAKLRDELRAAEIDLKEQGKRVAALRQRLPLDTPVPDYALNDGAREVRLSELFESPGLPVLLVHFMFGGKQAKPCPMCTMWADAYDGIAPYVARRANFGVLVAGDANDLRAYGRSRGWRNLRVLSAGDSTLKRDLGFESEEGAQHPGVSVFVRDGDGLRHFYSVSALLGDGHWNGMDLLCPTWHFLDLLPAGRGDWMPKGTEEPAPPMPARN